MNISPNNYDAQPKKKKKNGVNIAILVFVILTFIVASLILADNVQTKYTALKAGDGIVNSVQGEKADTQGNLGNFNVISRKNSIADNKDGTYTLTLEFLFTNYGEDGRSFNEAVDVTAYQNNKEVKNAVPSLDFTLGSNEEETTKSSSATNEADLKVRNGQSADVVLTYTLKNPNSDVTVDMTSADNSFTYTVKLTQSAPANNANSKETTTKANKG